MYYSGNPTSVDRLRVSFLWPQGPAGRSLFLSYDARYPPLSTPILHLSEGGVRILFYTPHCCLDHQLITMLLPIVSWYHRKWDCVILGSFDSAMVVLVVFLNIHSLLCSVVCWICDGLPYLTSPCLAHFLAALFPTLSGCFISSVHYMFFFIRGLDVQVSRWLGFISWTSWFQSVLMFLVGLCRGAYHTNHAVYFGVMYFHWYVTYVRLSVHSVCWCDLVTSVPCAPHILSAAFCTCHTYPGGLVGYCLAHGVPLIRLSFLTI